MFLILFYGCHPLVQVALGNSCKYFSLDLIEISEIEGSGYVLRGLVCWERVFNDGKAEGFFLIAGDSDDIGVTCQRNDFALSVARTFEAQEPDFRKHDENIGPLFSDDFLEKRSRFVPFFQKSQHFHSIEHLVLQHLLFHFVAIFLLRLSFALLFLRRNYVVLAILQLRFWHYLLAVLL